MRTRSVAAILVGLMGALARADIAAAAQPCAQLTALRLPDTTITAATVVQDGRFTPPAPPGANAASTALTLPPFCRVELTVTPHINVEVWLPLTGWNGKFEGVGGGGYAGVISYAALATALNAGYATASTDTGHVGNDPQFALGHPELVEDFGYRGIHQMTLTAKQVVNAFYGMVPRQSYFVGCSTGGRQGLMEAQRFPDDYIGIVSGAPAIDWPHLLTGAFRNAAATLKDPASYIPRSKLPAVNDASIAACDMADGVKDGLVADPRKCSFDPKVLLCKAGDSDACLTPKQVAAIETIYSPVRYSDGRLFYPQRLPGVERGWGNFITGAEPGRSINYVYGTGYLKYFVLQDAHADPMAMDFDALVAKVDADQKDIQALQTFDTNLKPFRDRGGKLILYHGWGDDAISPLNTINYFKLVVDKTTGGPKAADALAPEDAKFQQAAQKTGDFMRLFLVPGMNHCGGGPGPNTLDAVSALSSWVEKKQPPDMLLGTHLANGVADLTRPLCPYPQVAKYSGQGDVRSAANFSCGY